MSNNGTVQYHPGYDEYVAECDCGWVGDYLPAEYAAQRQLLAHANQHRAIQHQPVIGFDAHAETFVITCDCDWVGYELTKFSADRAADSHRRLS